MLTTTPRDRHFASRTRCRVFKQRLRRNPADPARSGFGGSGRGSACSSLACAGVITFDVWLATCGFYGCPSPAEIRAFHPSEGGNVYDRNQQTDRSSREHSPRQRADHRRSRRHVRDAFVATEDRRFYEHNGLDWHGVLRAVARNFSAGGIRQGFSTITMQVAHNSFLPDRYHGRSLRRKLVELRISRLLERELTKDQILEHYLNVIYLGNGVNGIEAASLDLFGKNVNKLTLPEGRAARRAAQGAVGLHAATQSAARRAAPQPRARADGRSGVHHRRAGAIGRGRTPLRDRRERVASVDHAASRARSTRCGRSSTRCCPTCSRRATSTSTRRSTSPPARGRPRRCSRTSTTITRETRETMGA